MKTKLILNINNKIKRKTEMKWYPPGCKESMTFRFKWSTIKIKGIEK